MDASRREADTLIVLAPDQASLYEFLRDRQGPGGGTVVILDQRRAERRNGGERVAVERRQRQRRAPTPAAALALMSVLGFMILHRDGGGWTT
jgi:hypothetical protein